MKKILTRVIPFLVLMGFSIDVYAQWVAVATPEVSSSWGLNKIRVLPSGNGWAVGVDNANKRGVILQSQNGEWSVVNPVPNVSSDWELTGFGGIMDFTANGQSESISNVWAVGVDFSTGSRKGIMLHYANGVWTVVAPPYVSLDWGLYDVSFVAPNEGWIAGTDYASSKGILLHYRKGVWTSPVPPDVSLDWGIYGIHMIAPNYGWAVGADHTNSRGSVLDYTVDPNNKSFLYPTHTWQVTVPPRIDNNWALNAISFPPVTGTSGDQQVPTVGWAVGVNHGNKKGTLLYFNYGNWAEVAPPEVSSDWELDSVHFLSSQSGWATGTDHENKKGIVLQYANGLWATSPVPEVSSDWGLNDIHFNNANDGWAAGTDDSNGQGILLRYAASRTETISTPSTPNGPTSIAPNVQFTYAAGGARSSLYHPVQYSFDWGDGTNSGWLPPGTTSVSKIWASAGSYRVTVQARCDTDTTVVSKLSSALSVTVSETPSPIALLSPPDGTSYTGCSLSSLPTFTWKAGDTFTAYEIQFSKTGGFDTVAVSDKTSSTSVSVGSQLWMKILTAPGPTGGPLFWRVIGTQSDKTTVISDTFSIAVSPPRTVGNATITNTSKSSTPTLSWDNQCNVKFKVWFGGDANFFRKSSLLFNIKNPNDNEGVFTVTLSSSQWLSVQQVVPGKGSGSPIFWYVESWDGANRHTIVQPPLSFVLTD